VDKQARDELLSRQYQGGSTVTNCVSHMRRSILDRDDECRLCRADVRNTLSRAIAANEWLNTWKEDAAKLIAADTV
jgi:hypothetical protein